jgi:hypothetical protein
MYGSALVTCAAVSEAESTKTQGIMDNFVAMVETA